MKFPFMRGFAVGMAAGGLALAASAEGDLPMDPIPEDPKLGWMRDFTDQDTGAEYKILAFTNVTEEIAYTLPSRTCELDYLIVGGGGGGGNFASANRSGGGGGGGGVITGHLTISGSLESLISVGAGGAHDVDGKPSRFTLSGVSYEIDGGGHGANGSLVAGSGATGGGGSQDQLPGKGSVGGDGAKGLNTLGGGTTQKFGGGGGGADGAPGGGGKKGDGGLPRLVTEGSATYACGGDGGIGVLSDLSGESLYYGGGGGGGACNYKLDGTGYPSRGGKGGLGGGGDGGYKASGKPGVDGLGGGGGGNDAAGTVAGKGGDGLVLLRCKLAQGFALKIR